MVYVLAENIYSLCKFHIWYMCVCGVYVCMLVCVYVYEVWVYVLYMCVCDVYVMCTCCV